MAANFMERMQALTDEELEALQRLLHMAEVTVETLEQSSLEHLYSLRNIWINALPKYETHDAMWVGMSLTIAIVWIQKIILKREKN